MKSKKTLCFISIILALLMAVSAFSVIQAYAADTKKAAVADDEDGDGFEDENYDDDYYGYDDDRDGYFGFLEKESITLKAGAVKSIDFDSSREVPLYKKKASTTNKKVAKGTIEEDYDNCNNYVKVYAFKKGTATIKFKDCYDNSHSLKVKVTTNPTIKVAGKKFKASKTYTVKKGKTIKVSITGKSPIVKNAYSSSKKSVAKVTSKNTAKTVKIKGYKKGSAKVTIKVNGVAFKIKVKVKAK